MLRKESAVELARRHLTPFALYVSDRPDAERYRCELLRLGFSSGNFVIQIVSDSEMRLPAIRTPTNLYEGAWSVSRLLTSISRR